MMELLFTAFTIASYVWLLDSREKILRFLCDEIGELEICRAIVVIDGGREYYRMKKKVRVLDCEYLRYQPKSFNFVEKEMLITAPISANSSVYIFLNQYDEEIGQIFQDLLRVVGKAIEDLEVRKRKEELLKTVRENLRQFQYLSDKLRNPLAVIFGALEMKDELGLEKACLMISESAEKIKRVLDELSECEVQTIRLTRAIF
jgi:signal transduction histidine kinase